jgi:putative transposase
MGRIPRVDIANIIYHVINRSNGRVSLFNIDKDYKSIEAILEEAHDKFAIKIYAYIIMPNHWHFVLSPTIDGELSRFMQWLTLTHTQRHHSIHKKIGYGHLYQGRYKSFPVQTNEYFLGLCRYVERNAVRARLVKKAEQWQWSSLWRREYGNKKQKKILTKWPTEIPEDYLEYVNASEKDENLEEIRYCINRGKPFGSMTWVKRIIDKYGLGTTTQKRGRLKKGT